LGIFPTFKQFVEDTGRVVIPRLCAPDWVCQVEGNCLSALVQPHAVCLRVTCAHRIRIPVSALANQTKATDKQAHLCKVWVFVVRKQSWRIS